MTKANQWITDGLIACLPPGTPLMGRIIKAKFTGKHKAEAALALFDGKPSVVEVSTWGPHEGAWCIRWLSLEHGDINWTGSAWERIPPVYRQASLFDEAVTA